MKDLQAAILFAVFLAGMTFMFDGNPSVFQKLREKTLQKLEVQQCVNPST